MISMKFFILRGEELILSEESRKLDDLSLKKRPDLLREVDGISEESEDIVADTSRETET